MFGRRTRPPTETDLQMRCRVVEKIADEIEERMKQGEMTEERRAIAELAYAVSYLSQLVEKHLRTGEK